MTLMDGTKWTPRDSKAQAIARLTTDLKLLRERHRRAIAERDRLRESSVRLLLIQENLMALLRSEQETREAAEERAGELEGVLANWREPQAAGNGHEDVGPPEYGPVS